MPFFLKKPIFLFFFSFICTLALIDNDKVTVYLIGDSTMANKDAGAFPETGWGTPFSLFFDSTVSVVNLAKNGRSSRTFREEGLWKQVSDNLKQGDYVFIQFGHNDEIETKKSYTTPEEFKTNLRRYITETMSRKATPILLTSVARRKFDDQGKLIDTHEVYSGLTREVAREMQVTLIDMDRESQKLLIEFGPQYSKLLFLHLAVGEHPNYPKGKEDDTHFNELGARRMAELVLAEIKKTNLELAQRIVKSGKK